MQTVWNLCDAAATKRRPAHLPVKLGLVASLSRPGSNATGINFFLHEVVAKRLRLLHDFLPKAVRCAVFVNPANVESTKNTVQEVQQSAPGMNLQIQFLNAATPSEIDAAFAALAREHIDSLFVAPDAFFTGRKGQFITLAAVNRIPATYSNRGFVAVGGLMSYGTDLAAAFHQVGVYTGKVLKGAKPGELPVLQSNKFELVINLQTARALGIEVHESCSLSPTKSSSNSPKSAFGGKPHGCVSASMSASGTKRTSAVN